MHKPTTTMHGSGFESYPSHLWILFPTDLERAFKLNKHFLFLNKKSGFQFIIYFHIGLQI